MFIHKYLPSSLKFTLTTTNKKTTKNEVQVNESRDPTEKIYKYNLSKAVISRFENNSIKIKISTEPEDKIFYNEKDLNDYLYSLRKKIDIFKIKDQRKPNSNPIYKYNDIAWKCINTFTKKNSLYYNIASENLGEVFKINDLDKQKQYYLKKNTKWLFFWNFERIDSSSAYQTVYNKAKSQERWKKIYSLGLISLALSPTIYGATCSASQNLSSIANNLKSISLPTNSPLGVSNIIDPNIITLVAANILINSFTQKNSFERRVSSLLSIIKLVNANFCPTLNNYPLSDAPFAVVNNKNYTYVTTRSSFIIYERNQSNLWKTGECSNPNPAYYTPQGIAPTDNMSYVAAEKAVFAIDTVNKSAPFIADIFNTTDARAIATSEGKVYFGSKWDTFDILNGSLPMTPLGSITGVNFSSKRIIISNNFAYSIGGSYLIRINVTDPLFPSIKGYISVPGIIFDGDKLNDLILIVGSYYSAYNTSNSASFEQIGNSSALSPVGKAIKINNNKEAFIGSVGSITSWNIDSPGSPYNEGNFSILGSVALDIFNDELYSLETNPNNLNTIKLNCFPSTTSSSESSSTSSSISSSSSTSSISSSTTTSSIPSSSTSSSSFSSNQSSSTLSSSKSFSSSSTITSSIPSSSTSSSSFSSNQSSSTLSSSKTSSDSSSYFPIKSTTLSLTELFSSKKIMTINSATSSTINPSITSIGTKNIHSSNSSSTSTIWKWVISSIIGIIAIPASILAFVKLKKKTPQDLSDLEMQTNDSEMPTQVIALPTLSSTQYISAKAEKESQDHDDENPVYTELSQFQTQTPNPYSKLFDVALEQEKYNVKNNYANLPIRENFDS